MQNTLDEEFHGTPALVPMDIPPPTINEGNASNGITVISEDSRSPLATVTVNIGLGTRDTSLATSGTAMLLKHLAFGTTENRSKLRIDRELENIGAAVSATVDREILRLHAAFQAQHFNTLIDIVGDSVTNASLKDYDVRDVLHYVNCDITDNGSANALSDAIHAAAFYDSETLGLPLYGSASGASRASAVALAQKAIVGSNITLVGTGIDHDVFAQGVSDRFSGVSTGSHSRSAAEYVGGEARVATSGGSTSVAVAFSTADASPAAAQVLSTIVGSAQRRPTRKIGGSIGGLAAAVLANNDAISSASGFANTYSDAGIVGIAASTTGDNVETTFAQLSAALKDCNISDDDVARAKAVLRGNAAVRADSHIGRGAAISDAATGSGATQEAIEAITTAEVKAALSGALGTAPSFATVGDITSAPRYNALSRHF
jgi:predicted Zn-dependent peptidase